MTTYLKPATLDEALAALARLGPDVCILAGGTDLMVPVRASSVQPAAMINIFRLEELRRISLVGPSVHPEPVEGRASTSLGMYGGRGPTSLGVNGGARLELGAAVTVAALLKSKDVLTQAPLLWKAADRFGSPLVRARATLGGNLCTASPAADLSLALLALDADVLLASASGRRVVPLEQFVLGVRKTALKPGELVLGVSLPVAPGAFSRFEKSGTRPALEISMAALAFTATLRDGKVLQPRLACGAVAPTPMRARKAEGLIAGRALDAELIEACAEAAAVEVRPIDDFRASARYRRRLIAAYVRRCLEALRGPARSLDATGS